MTDFSFRSETERLTEVLVCRPDHYRWIPTNAVAVETLAGGAVADRAAAVAQHTELVDALVGAGVTCRFLEPEPHLPYQVYTRDSSQITPWGPVLTQLRMPQRRGEYAAVLAFYETAGQPIWRYATHGTIEGGDIALVRPGLALVGCSGGRTDLDGATQFARWFEAEGWEVWIVPFAEHFLHLDVIFCMVADGLAVACLDVLDDDLVDRLRAVGLTLVPATYKEVMALSSNVLALGDDRVISPRHSTGLNTRLRAEGLTVLDPELDVFTRGGGGAHCLTMPLRRESR